MIEAFLVSLATLLIALYLQARRAARSIRRNRAVSSPDVHGGIAQTRR